MLTLLKHTFRNFLDDEAPVRAAALAYYTVFALPPLLVLLIMFAGLVWDPGEVQRAMESQFASIIGPEAARAVQGMIAAAGSPGGDNVLRTVLSVAGLMFGATGAFLQLQTALNKAWGVVPDSSGGLRRLLVKRVLSLGMILVVGFLVAVSLALSALISMAGDRLGEGFPRGILMATNLVLSLVVLSLLLAAIYKVLPDAQIAWRDVMVGAVVTAVLFVAGKFAIGVYLGRSEPGEVFGTAGALAVILVWVYFAGMILLLGAEFTQAWARRKGRPIQPVKGAVRADDPAASAAAARKSRKSSADLTISPGSRTMSHDATNGDSHRAHAADRALPPARRDGAGDSMSSVNGLDEQSVGDLFKQLSTDTSHLFRQEINLARAELAESASHMVKGARNVGIAAGLALPGLLAFAAFLVIALGDVLNNYWASALIVSGVMLGVAALVAKKGLAEFTRGSRAPEATVGTLREDLEWAKEETQAFKRAFTAPKPRTH